MKKLSVAVSIALAILCLPKAALADDFSPVLVPQVPENVFAPSGFDNNDNAQVVIYGNLPNTCHKAGPVDHHIDHERKIIYVRNQSYFYSGCWCAEVMTPFVHAIDLGPLKAGEYEVLAQNPDSTFTKMAKFPVAVTTSADPDEYLYAPVEQLVIENGKITLSGTFKSSCMSLKEVKLNYRPNRVIEVLPIAEMAEEGCEKQSRPFKATVKIKESAAGRVLIHVRSLNGKALNQVVEL